MRTCAQRSASDVGIMNLAADVASLPSTVARCSDLLTYSDDSCQHAFVTPTDRCSTFLLAVKFLFPFAADRVRGFLKRFQEWTDIPCLAASFSTE